MWAATHSTLGLPTSNGLSRDRITDDKAGGYCQCNGKRGYPGHTDMGRPKVPAKYLGKLPWIETLMLTTTSGRSPSFTYHFTCSSGIQIFVRSWPTKPNFSSRPSTDKSTGVLAVVEGKDEREHATISFSEEVCSEGPTMH